MKYKSTIGISLGLFALIVFYSCELQCGECFSPPDLISFQYLDADSSDLFADSILYPDSVSIYYLDHKVRKNVQFDFGYHLDTTEIILFSDEMAWKSVEGFKTFYIELNSNDTDTLYFDVVRHEERCCTSHPVKSVNYNGKPLVHDPVSWIYKIIK